jgi:hypothetical protein
VVANHEAGTEAKALAEMREELARVQAALEFERAQSSAMHIRLIYMYLHVGQNIY